MTSPRGFLEHDRDERGKRAPDERVADHRTIFTLQPVEHVRPQAERCMNCGIPFCQNACPVSHRIPAWNGLVARDRWRDALTQAHAANNFPEFTGYICPAPCEAACVLEINDDPVTIKHIELEIIERGYREGWVQPQPPATRTGRHVAVVGSGPAGLAVAAQLNSMGHSVVVLERDEGVGGLLRFGVPDFKLEKWVIDRRVAVLEREGVEFRCGVDVGRDVTVRALREDYDAVVLAVGAQLQRPLDVDGADLEGVHLAMDYLTQHNRVVAATPEGEEPEPAAGGISATGKHVVVVGGGDTAADCVATALREGAVDAQQYDRYPEPDGTRPRELAGWPDLPKRTPSSYALEEGGDRVHSEVLTGLAGEGGRLTHALGTGVGPPPDFAPVEGTEFRRPAELVLVAIGFLGPERDGLLDGVPVDITDRGTLAVSDFATSLPGVFACGDAAVGQSLVVTAIDQGRRCAVAVDRHLRADVQDGLRPVGDTQR